MSKEWSAACRWHTEGVLWRRDREAQNNPLESFCTAIIYVSDAPLTFKSRKAAIPAVHKSETVCA